MYPPVTSLTRIRSGGVPHTTWVKPNVINPTKPIMNKMMLISPIFSLQALCCAFVGIPKQAIIKPGHQNVMIAQYIFQKLGGRSCSSICFWRCLASLVILPCLPDDLRRLCSDFSGSPVSRFFEACFLRGGESSEAASPDTFVEPSRSSKIGSLPVDDGSVFMLAACFL